MQSKLYINKNDMNNLFRFFTIELLPDGRFIQFALFTTHVGPLFALIRFLFIIHLTVVR